MAQTGEKSITSRDQWPEASPEVVAAIAKASASPQGKERVSRLTVGGELIWLKDFDQPSPPKWHGMQRSLFLLTRLQLLRPVPSYAGAMGAEKEAEAIRRARAIGARAPAVLWLDGARLALSDMGQTLRDMERRVGSAAIEGPILAACRELQRLHAHGAAHGRPILRNLTWDGERVGLIDFEEEPTAVMPVEAAQARDVLLLLMSIGRRAEGDLVRSAFDALAGGMAPGVEAELRRLARVGRPLAGALDRPLLHRRSPELTGLVRALTALRFLDAGA